MICFIFQSKWVDFVLSTLVYVRVCEAQQNTWLGQQPKPMHRTHSKSSQKRGNPHKMLNSQKIESNKIKKKTFQQFQWPRNDERNKS